ncbi:unnamed protein product [Discula destructiva]
MKFQIAATLLAAASVNALAVEMLSTPTDMSLDSSVMNSAAFAKFQNARVMVKTPAAAKRQNVVTPDNIFVLQCVDPGFREPCLVFGAPPGECVSYFDFQAENSTAVSDIYHLNVTSLATNTGGNCMYFQKEGCNILGDDRGLTSKYIYDMSVALPTDDRIPQYNNNVTSWRC